MRPRSKPRDRGRPAIRSASQRRLVPRGRKRRRPRVPKDPNVAGASARRPVEISRQAAKLRSPPRRESALGRCPWRPIDRRIEKPRARQWRQGPLMPRLAPESCSRRHSRRNDCKEQQARSRRPSGVAFRLRLQAHRRQQAPSSGRAAINAVSDKVPASRRCAGAAFEDPWVGARSANSSSWVCSFTPANLSRIRTQFNFGDAIPTHSRVFWARRTRSPQRCEARWSCPHRQKSARRGALTQSVVTSVKSSRYGVILTQNVRRDRHRRLRLDILDGRALQRTNKVGFPLCAHLPVPPVHRPNRGHSLPCSVFPFHTSKSAQPNERQGICAIARERREAISPVRRE